MGHSGGGGGSPASGSGRSRSVRGRVSPEGKGRSPAKVGGSPTAAVSSAAMAPRDGAASGRKGGREQASDGRRLSTEATAAAGRTEAAAAAAAEDAFGKRWGVAPAVQDEGGGQSQPARGWPRRWPHKSMRPGRGGSPFDPGGEGAVRRRGAIPAGGARGRGAEGTRVEGGVHFENEGGV